MMQPSRSLGTRFLRDDQAATSAEFALVVPVFLLLIFATINGSIMMSAVTQMHYATERAARCLSVDVEGACSAATVDAYAKSFYNGPSLAGMSFAASSPGCGNQVAGSGSYQLITGLDATAVSIRSTACYPEI